MYKQLGWEEKYYLERRIPSHVKVNIELPINKMSDIVRKTY